MADTPGERAEQRAAVEALTASAREWHKLQIAALAFVGLCGVLTGDNGTRLPMWLQSVAGVLALLALGFAAIGLLLVAVVAWPPGVLTDLSAGARRLRAGVAFTCVAVGLTALSASSNWWPESGADRPVQVSTNGGTACGPIVDSAAGWIDLDVEDTVLRVDLTKVVSLRPVESC
ncbi:hypothetical protein [Nocardioides sediminis]|uniref:hypothetical protein n=1 Tax=Nocardioides sediminis TaxID=433648 RepID=UPI000D317139|nr:hypothetical protein [Nocardioides sediminis]